MHEVETTVQFNIGFDYRINQTPEQISNNDGTKKQDCKHNAAKRVLKNIRTTYPKLKIIISGDGLYSDQPFVDDLKKAKMSFILVAKPKDHKVLNNQGYRIEHNFGHGQKNLSMIFFMFNVHGELLV